MSWGFGAGYPLPPCHSLLKSLLWHKAGLEASGEVDPGEGSRGHDGPGREGGWELRPRRQGKHTPTAPQLKGL